jgi:hypothetical protein
MRVSSTSLEELKVLSYQEQTRKMKEELMSRQAFGVSVDNIFK